MPKTCSTSVLMGDVIPLFCNMGTKAHLTIGGYTELSADDFFTAFTVENAPSLPHLVLLSLALAFTL